MAKYIDQTEAAYLASRRGDMTSGQRAYEDRRNEYAEREHPGTPRYRGDTGAIANTADGNRRNRDIHTIYTKRFRGKGPRNYKRSDERIYTMVCDLLCDDPYLDASDIAVEVKNGSVILTGLAEDRFAKGLAEELVERVLGVVCITNRIDVNQDNTYPQGQKHVRRNIV